MEEEIVAIKVLEALTQHITAHMSTHLQVAVGAVVDLFRQSIISTETVQKRLLLIMGLHLVGEEAGDRLIDSTEIQTLQITICFYDRLNDTNRRPP